MKHRGRHRRRKRGQALRAFLAGTALALTGAATLISTSQAQVGTDPGGIEPVTSAVSLADLRLSEEWVPRPVPAGPARPVGVAAVLEDADRSLRAAAECTGAERSALPIAPAATRAHCWDEAGTEGWRSGAVTTSGDADDDGRWGSKRVVLAGFSDRQGHSRVAFVDADDPDRLTYTWVALTVPASGDPVGRPLASTLSGMVWYQDKLLVTADDGRALYVYDVDRIRRASGDPAQAAPPARSERYTLPAVRSYRLTGARIGALSLDRSTTPDSLVASESVPADGDRPTRLWRYALDDDPSDAGLLGTGPRQVYETKAADVRGVLARGSRWYLARAAGERGTLWRQDGDGARAARCGTDETYLCWSGPAQSLSYSAESGEVWSQSGRMLFALPLSAIDRALG
ncbi:hypothetical protein [Streptomyces chromofuscus]|uniref:Secreted protein n=1 Tax=Streptomyces chromofuscus TaxID=42881 RepID=A0A7M2T6Y5_STRCW|nr:hypothetical protein [Streptomyces chromofuscus]QOV43665.1 hypothetical protein IPT68_28730 [Streptomyces chromofuscus]GGT42170.1 hypothetical protein GCM10010254_72230 [Streptomyces chromofuscus]